MASSAAASGSGTRDANARTPAQVYSLVFGATLLLAGILGFFVNSEFDVGSNVQGDELILFEVNGWHNIIHIASGLVGLAAASKAKTAYAFALGFGLVYALVTVWGLITGDNILFGVAPINGADNLLHAAIALAGILAALASRPSDNPSTRAA